MVGPRLDFRCLEGCGKPRLPFANMNLVPLKRDILVHDDLFIFLVSTLQTHRVFRVLEDIPLIVIGEKSPRLGEVLFNVGVQSCGYCLSHIRIRGSQCLRRGVIPGVARKSSRASSLATHASMEAANVSARSCHPRMRWRRPGGDTSVSTAS